MPFWHPTHFNRHVNFYVVIATRSEIAVGFCEDRFSQEIDWIQLRTLKKRAPIRQVGGCRVGVFQRKSNSRKGYFYCVVARLPLYVYGVLCDVIHNVLVQHDLFEEWHTVNALITCVIVGSYVFNEVRVNIFSIH